MRRSTTRSHGSLHDFADWRDRLQSVRELGAFRTIDRNLIVSGAATQLVPVAEMTASGFRLARIAPSSDGRSSRTMSARALPGFWSSAPTSGGRGFRRIPRSSGARFVSATAVHTVIGVMPAGFAFPMNHGLWIPLRANPLDYARREGPELSVFGRLAPGADARAGAGGADRDGAAGRGRFSRHAWSVAAPRDPLHGSALRRHARMERSRPRECPSRCSLRCCASMSLCWCTRGRPLATPRWRCEARWGRAAAGSSRSCSRRPWCSQAAPQRLDSAIAALSLHRLDAIAASLSAPMGGVPFWIELRVSPRTIAYAMALAVLAAVVVGIIPALSATGRRLQSRLSDPGAATGMRLGRTWTVLIVAQVAFAAAALPSAILYAGQFVRSGLADPGFPADEFLTASLVMDRELPRSLRRRCVRARIRIPLRCAAR